MGEFAMRNVKMNNPVATSLSTSDGTGYYQNWHYTGPFKGVFSGGWWGVFTSQGSVGGSWSSSARPGWSDYALSVSFDATGVYPGNNNRSGGSGVRCLLN